MEKLEMAQEERIGENDIPVYTRPHQWQGLTDDEISKLWCTDHASYLEFAHAIEQALKEKNHGS
jgi:hypothetical protein